MVINYLCFGLLLLLNDGIWHRPLSSYSYQESRCMREVDGQDVWSKIKIRQSRTYVHHDGWEQHDESGDDDVKKDQANGMLHFIPHDLFSKL